MKLVQVTGSASAGTSQAVSASAADIAFGPIDTSVTVELADKNEVGVAALAVDVDAPFVGLGANGAKGLVILTTAPVVVKLTSAKGALQKLPVSRLLIVFSEDFPYTAMKIDGGDADAVVTWMYGGEAA